MSETNNIPTLWNGSKDAQSVLILAHGAGAPMDTDFMNYFADTLSSEDISVLRFEFPYMALRRQGHGRRPPNTQKILLETWRQIINDISRSHKSSLVIGGKSMGGRMASMIADECEVDGLVCLGYPFYAPGKLDKPRIDHLGNLKTHSLILQGERDPMGSKEVVDSYALSPAIAINWFADGNHDLKPRKASGITHQKHLQSAATAISRFICSLKSN